MTGRRGPGPEAAGAAPLLVLVADDDPHIRELCRLYLEAAGYRVAEAASGAAALARIAEGGVDLLVLDIMLPDGDGWEVLRRLREGDGWLPVLMLTAVGGEQARVEGLESGADDYLTKPFSPRELVARVRAILRRVPPQPPENADTVVLPGLVIDPGKREAWCGRRRLNLTPREFDLLYFLARHPRQVFSREQLLENIWGYDFEGDDRTVDVHVTRLRKKLEAADAPYRYLETVWGQGYRLAPEPRPA
ncbi:Transcriptional regulatory protein ResD [Candidatus Hydrogenisulfobacillus filiaventi]|uniref:Stage 0 sporulation protein A homolog n=1 Tax=Candidatus Hydrogenisulfobacillus filiaventi TaxID=2707344 RepID=A0A6F8ZDN8_9FIRM|nr:response regulator transcription factor [Bacillota bacterium]CAB1128126.1 Transcriptional regulatory protein ResD [Candidatus Hydrogenisulfobacillus filiaventi]